MNSSISFSERAQIAKENYPGSNDFLEEGKSTGSKTGKIKFQRAEAERLESFIELHNLWYGQIDEERNNIDGGEQGVSL